MGGKKMENIYDRTIDLGEYKPEPDDDRIICRCEEVTKGEIRRAVHDGMYTYRDPKISAQRHGTLPGTDLCEGCKRNCGKGLGVSPAVLTPATSRAPMRPLEMKIFAKEGEEDE